MTRFLHIYSAGDIHSFQGPSLKEEGKPPTISVEKPATTKPATINNQNDSYPNAKRKIDSTFKKMARAFFPRSGGSAHNKLPFFKHRKTSSQPLSTVEPYSRQNLGVMALPSLAKAIDPHQRISTFFSLIQKEVAKLQSESPKASSLHEDALQKIYRQFLRTGLSEETKQEAHETFLKSATNILAELRNQQGHISKDAHYLLTIDLLDRIHVNVFGRMEFLSDADLRRLVDMVVEEKIDLPLQEKAIEHINNNLYLASPETGQYLIDNLNKIPSSRLPHQIKGLQKRLENEAFIFQQRLSRLPSLVRNKIIDIKEISSKEISSKEISSKEISIHPEIQELIEDSQDGNNYKYKMTLVYENFQKTIDGIDLWEIHQQSEQYFLKLLGVIGKIMRLGRFDMLFGEPKSLVSRLIEMMADRRMSDECVRNVAPFVNNLVYKMGKENDYLFKLNNIHREGIPELRRRKEYLERKSSRTYISDLSSEIHALFNDETKNEKHTQSFINKWRINLYYNDQYPTEENISHYKDNCITLNERLHAFQKSASDILNSFIDDDARLSQALNKLEKIRLGVFGRERFFPDDFLVKLARRMATGNPGAEFYALGIQLLDDNVYDVSDETARILLQELKKISSIAPSQKISAEISAKISALQARLEKFPDSKIPKIFKWVWRGGEWRTNTIKQMIEFHKLNPNHRLVAYASDPEDIYAAMDKYASEIPRGQRGLEFAKRAEQISALKRVLEIRHEDVLSKPAIRNLLKGKGKQEFSRLDAIAQRNGESTGTKPNYSLISDLERLAVLLEEGGIYVDHNCISLIPVSENARAEAGLATQVYLNKRYRYSKPQLGIENTAILAAPANSKEIKILLKFLNDNYDKPENKKTKEEKEHPFDPDEIKWRYASFLNHRWHYQENGEVVEEKMDITKEPITWTAGRFSYITEEGCGWDVYEHISKVDVTLRAVANQMIGRVMLDHWKTSKMSEPELTKLYLQSGAAFLLPSILKPEAPGNWARGVPAPGFTMDDTRVANEATHKAEERLKEVRKYSVR
jgi:hypothetical protein